MELYGHSNISVWGIKGLKAIKLKSMLFSFSLKGFQSCFSFLTASQVFEDEKVMFGLCQGQKAGE